MRNRNKIHIWTIKWVKIFSSKSDNLTWDVFFKDMKLTTEINISIFLLIWSNKLTKMSLRSQKYKLIILLYQSENKTTCRGRNVIFSVNWFLCWWIKLSLYLLPVCAQTSHESQAGSSSCSLCMETKQTRVLFQPLFQELQTFSSLLWLCVYKPASA